METPPVNSTRTPWPLQAVAALVVGVVTGILAAQVQTSGTFRVGIQSLAAGAVLSVMLVGTLSMFHSSRPRWPVALLASMLAIVAQHYWLFRLVMKARETELALKPAGGLFRPDWANLSFLGYMQAEANGANLLWWGLDACLLTLAAVVIVEMSASWFTPRGE